ncbi:hypothetical protein BWI97_11055 [Siphonobacter sp. BAB-5405]|uniref:hypothetical protein n=1 Tax=Siphonobacter sp. BAB-5405 TaxID=1864825 RepID=UPI000C803C45|nr:hypothetical protein [Siphonobacter sp. BAB-5405]PMD96701.1 hypothetical protein BWI97_11055 [Siphonobacter sp. BAB-5405]
MSRLFLFAIGGTGARVVKSLTYLLASGVKLRNTTQVIPILMDPHAENKDLKRTKEILNQYQNVRSSLQNPPSSGLFGTDIQTLKRQLPSASIADSFQYELKGVSDEKYGNYIGHDSLDESNHALADLLFSKEQLDTKMDIGFVGNPNIGSVVLNQFRESEEFKAFVSSFKREDKVFIVSSIFGGTGAAGFPLILKNIRGYGGSDAKDVREARIGAVSVQPYFDVYSAGAQDKAIDNATFISKTKAALGYYQNSLSNKEYPKLNALYYLAESYRSPYEYDPGAGGQQNDAHYIEMVGALSVVDFCEHASELECTVRDGQIIARNPRYSEFGLGTSNNRLNFADFVDRTRQVIARPLSQFGILSQYLKTRVERDGILGSNSAPWTSKEAPKIGSDFRQTKFYRNLHDFNENFRTWLLEMNDHDRNVFNKRTFRPFNLATEDLGKFIPGFERTKKNFFGKTVDVEIEMNKGEFDEYLNAESKGKTYVTPEDKFLTLMNTCTDQFLQKEYSQLSGS